MKNENKNKFMHCNIAWMGWWRRRCVPTDTNILLNAMRAMYVLKLSPTHCVPPWATHQPPYVLWWSTVVPFRSLLFLPMPLPSPSSAVALLLRLIARARWCGARHIHQALMCSYVAHLCTSHTLFSFYMGSKSIE